MLDSIKADLLNEERFLARENKTSDRAANALQVHRANDRLNRRNKPRTPEEKARYTQWLKNAECRCCKQIGHIEATCPKSKSYSQSSTRNTVESTQAKAEVEIDAMLCQATLEGDPSAYLASMKEPSPHVWVIGSRCSHHMTL